MRCRSARPARPSGCREPLGIGRWSTGSSVIGRLPNQAPDKGANAGVESAVAGCATAPQPPLGLVDFMSDALHQGVRFRTFNVFDGSNRKVWAIEIDTSLATCVPVTEITLFLVFGTIMKQATEYR